MKERLNNFKLLTFTALLLMVVGTLAHAQVTVDTYDVAAYGGTVDPGNLTGIFEEISIIEDESGAFAKGEQITVMLPKGCFFRNPITTACLVNPNPDMYSDLKPFVVRGGQIGDCHVIIEIGESTSYNPGNPWEPPKNPGAFIIKDEPDGTYGDKDLATVPVHDGIAVRVNPDLAVFYNYYTIWVNENFMPNGEPDPGTPPFEKTDLFAGFFVSGKMQFDYDFLIIPYVADTMAYRSNIGLSNPNEKPTTVMAEFVEYSSMDTVLTLDVERPLNRKPALTGFERQRQLMKALGSPQQLRKRLADLSGSKASYTIIPGTYLPLNNVIREIEGLNPGEVSNKEGFVVVYTTGYGMPDFGVIGGAINNWSNDPSVDQGWFWLFDQAYTPVVLKSGPWSTRLILTNVLGSGDVNGTITLYDATNPVTTYTMGFTVGNQNLIKIDDLVSALGAPAGTYGMLEIQCDGMLVGQVQQYNVDNTGGIYPILSLFGF